MRRQWYSRMLGVVLVFVVALCFHAEPTFADIGMRKLLPADGAAGDHFGISSVTDGELLVIGSYLDDHGGLTDAGAAYLFGRSQGGVNGWGQVKKLVVSDPISGHSFGYGMSLNSDTLGIGAAYDADSYTGQSAVYIFYRNQGGADNWGQKKKVHCSDPELGDRFGVSIDVDGDLMAVGAHSPNSTPTSPGKAYLFSRNQGGADQWGQIKKLSATGLSNGDAFGVSVALDGDTLAVGAQLHDPSESVLGAVYVFQQNAGGSGNWGQVKKITADDSSFEGGLFGHAVELSGDYLFVGARADANDENSGVVYVFKRDLGGENNWGKLKKILAPDAAPHDDFGIAMDYSGGMLVVGAPLADTGGVNNAGVAYYFGQHEGGTENWGFLRKVVSCDKAASDSFGASVAIAADTIAIGAYNNDDAGNNSGSAYVIDSLACEGDLDVDGDVDATDLAVLLGAWGACQCCVEDLNNDGTVDASDNSILLGAWGDCDPGLLRGSATPEELQAELALATFEDLLDYLGSLSFSDLYDLLASFFGFE
jgi:FG-GAP repeat